MKFRIVDLGRDFPGKITDFAKARNTFLEGLLDNEYVLFVEPDEEVPKMLLDYIASLKPQYPYYNIRRINLLDNRFVPLWNPGFVAKLCSNKVRFVRGVHEIAMPRTPCGWIDIPTIHNQLSTDSPYPVKVPRWYGTRLYRLLFVLFKLRDILRGRDWSF